MSIAKNFGFGNRAYYGDPPNSALCKPHGGQGSGPGVSPRLPRVRLQDGQYSVTLARTCVGRTQEGETDRREDRKTDKQTEDNDRDKQTTRQTYNRQRQADKQTGETNKKIETDRHHRQPQVVFNAVEHYRVVVGESGDNNPAQSPILYACVRARWRHQPASALNSQPPPSLPHYHS